MFMAQLPESSLQKYEARGSLASHGYGRGFRTYQTRSGDAGVQAGSQAGDELRLRHRLVNHLPPPDIGGTRLGHFDWGKSRKTLVIIV